MQQTASATPMIEARAAIKTMGGGLVMSASVISPHRDSQGYRPTTYRLTHIGIAHDTILRRRPYSCVMSERLGLIIFD